jgi:branched-chain amino acid transport system substrate-binding protein
VKIWLPLVLALLLLAGCGAQEPVKIGFLGGMSGRIADLGEAGRNGTQLAVEQANAAGGIAGRQIELLVLDDAQNPEKARAAIDHFAAAGVTVVIGPMTSAVAEAIYEHSAQAGLILVSPTVTASKFLGKDDHLLRVVSSTREHARINAEAVCARGQKRVAVAYDTQNAAYTLDWLAQFRTAAQSLCGAPVAAEPFASGDEASHAAAIEKLGAGDPDALHFVANASDTVRLVQLARSAGMTQEVSAATWAATEQLIELGGRNVEGLRTTQFFDRTDTTPKFQAFRASYASRFGQEPGFASVAAYDAAQAAIAALRGRPAGPAVKTALLNGGPYAGVQMEWNFDRYGDAERPAWATVVRDGRFVRAD